MLKFFIILFFVFLSIPSWSQINNYMDSVMELKSTEEKKVFLKRIFNADQDVRHRWNEVENSSNDSLRASTLAEYRNVDSVNLKKIEAYLKIHGYPNLERDGFSSSTPWLVIHHSTRNISRIKNFKILLNAFREGSLDKELLLMYISRALSIEKKEDFLKFYLQDVEKLIEQMEAVYDMYCSGK